MNLPPTILLLGPPGSGKSTLARQALRAGGSGLIALAPGMDEYTSYREFGDNPAYKIVGFDDAEFYPMAGSRVATGYTTLLGWLRGVHKTLSEEKAKGEALRFNWLVTDTFSSMTTLAMNQTLAHIGVDEPPPAMSPSGAAFWGYQRNLCEALMRACRSIRGLGVGWIATCHVTEKEMKETSVANPDHAEGTKKHGIVPAISGGFRDVVAGGFDAVLHTGVLRTAPDKPPTHYVQWQPSGRRPTKSRYGALGNGARIAANWGKLAEMMEKAEQP